MHLSSQVFDELIDRSNMNSDKWAKYPKDVIPMWVADMDFDAPQVVKEAVAKRVDEGVFGYTYAPKELTEGIIAHLKTRYDWQVSASQLVHLPGLVCALHLSVRALTKKGDGIVVPGPVYYHLTKAPLAAERTLKSVTMTIQQGRWLPDMEEFEKLCAQADSKMILLCNPHNPGGTMYTREELLAMHEIAKRYDLLVVSDEIHCDLILDEIPHVPFASLNEDAAQRTITLMAPSKTFNLAGLAYAFAVITNSKIRNAFSQAGAGLVPSPNLLGMEAASAAFNQGQAWHKALLNYLQGNRDLLQQRLAKTPLKMAHLQATYLAWIDVSELGLSDPYRFFLDAGVGVSNGKDFGNPNFVRLNFGCPRSRLELAITRIEKALKTQGFS
ncbi:MalY/PatB family protein [Marinomonas epiphytica]